MRITTDGDGHVTFEVDSEHERIWLVTTVIPSVQQGDVKVVVR